jgi:ParB/RepB/Spo0J family partition protein
MSERRPAGKPRNAADIGRIAFACPEIFAPKSLAPKKEIKKNYRVTASLKVEDIEIRSDRRSLNDESVSVLASSMAKIGLKSPISVRIVPVNEESGDYHLIAGAHRLAAAKKLGWKHIECFVVENESDDQARLWEIAENLHRAELTAQERAEEIAEWVRITNKGAQCAQVSKGGRGNEGGISAASRELGLGRTEVQRAIKIASLTPEAKEAARDAGLDDNRSALLKAAKQHDPKVQSEVLAKIAAEKAERKANPIKVANNEISAETLEAAVAAALAQNKAVQPPAPHVYTRPADKYFAAQEAKLGPITRVTLTKEMRTDIGGARASILAAAKRINQYGIPEIATAIAAAVDVIDRYLA